MALILDMPMQDNAANMAVDDVSVSNNNGVASANTSTLTTTGPSSTLLKAFAFNGTTTKVTLGTPIILPAAGPWTIQTHIKPTANADYGICGHNVGDASILLGSNGNITIVDDGANALEIEDVDPSVGGWSHIAIVYNGTELWLYLNGVSIAQPSFTFSEDITIDTLGSDGSFFFAGSLCFDNAICDEVRNMDQVAADARIGGIGATKPTMTGTLRVGQTLTVVPGTWAGQTLDSSWFDVADDALGTNVSINENSSPWADLGIGYLGKFIRPSDGWASGSVSVPGDWQGPIEAAVAHSIAPCDNCGGLGIGIAI